jgi:hypothetical protein
VDCGQVLTDEESIDRGRGPVCFEHHLRELPADWNVWDYEPLIDIDIEQEPFFSKYGCDSPYTDKICKEGHLPGSRWEVLIEGAVHEFCYECFEYIEETRSMDEPED